MSTNTTFTTNRQPAVLQTADMAVWKPAVDGILRRFNEPASRDLAGLEAAILLQAMTAMGIFGSMSIVPNTQPPARQLAGADALRAHSLQNSLVSAVDNELSKVEAPAARPRAS